MRTFLSILLAVASVAIAAPPPAFQNLELVDEIDPSIEPADEDRFRQHPANISRVETILDGKVRLLPNDTPGIKYFGYRLGVGKGLKAGEAYVLEVEYPEDEPRTIYVLNMGAETSRGFHTGRTIGDAFDGRFVYNVPESLELPLSGRFQKWQTLFHLHERYPELKRSEQRTGRPENGFWVFFQQLQPEQAPYSKGTAISRIRLYKAPPLEDYALKLNLPPAGLPQRHLFFREEMSDNVVSKDMENRAFIDGNHWFENKMLLMRFLGMNTYSKDLLEFGSNQGWDSARYGGDEWVYQSHEPDRWNRMVETAGRHGLNVLPYYKYSGSKGKKGLGNERRAIPLNEREHFTHVKFIETARADLTDPDTLEDFRRMLEITVFDLKEKANFVGAWLRPRPSQLPIGFGDGALKRFGTETQKEEPVTRQMLQNDTALYDSYIAWWKEKRKEFLFNVRRHLQTALGDEAVLLYTADTTETGRAHPQKTSLVAEDPDLWKEQKGTSLEAAIKERRQFGAMTLTSGTWGGWEWHHAAPPYDPEKYADEEGVLPTFSFNRAYTVGDSEALDAFRTKSGLAMVRHYPMNENLFREEVEGKPVDPLGYFVMDVELAGPYSMLAEARAMANGDPRFLGYLVTNSFNRGFPDHARRFNAAFLALPALPSVRLVDATADHEVAVRKIEAAEHGTYLAIVNTGYGSKEKISVTLPAVGKVQNAATLEDVETKDGVVTLDLDPCELIALRILRD